MKKILIYILVFVIVLIFIGCSSDDEEIITREMTLYPGWNLVSFPFDFGVKSKLEVVPDTIQYAYNYNASNRRYETVEYIQGGIGYWIYSEDTLKIDIEGEPIDSLSIQLYCGWNILPSLYKDIYCEELYEIRNFKVVYYFENNIYELGENTLKSRYAYFLLSISEGILIITEDTVIFDASFTLDTLDMPMSPPPLTTLNP